VIKTSYDNTISDSNKKNVSTCIYIYMYICLHACVLQYNNA
jgi:hypothetical protein